MKRSEKGRFAPPPRLPAAAQRVAQTVAGWDGVEARTHWLLGDETRVDGADYYYGDEELGHIHLYAQAHVFHSAAVTDALIKAGLGEPFAYNRAVTVFDVESDADVEHAVWLFRLSYQRRTGAKNAELLAEINRYARKAS